MKYVVDAVDKDTQFNVAHYQVLCFGVLMIGESVRGGTHSTITISPAVPGAQYRVAAWALGDGRRSAAPAVEKIVTEEASESNSLLPIQKESAKPSTIYCTNAEPVNLYTNLLIML